MHATMFRHIPASASMAMTNGALQGWKQLEEKLTSKLSQLTKLLHHFSAYPPESPDGDDDEIAGQHDSEIHEILNETASRIRQFKTTLEVQIQDNRVQETIQAISSQYEALREASDIELKTCKLKSEQLEKGMKEREEELLKIMDNKTESFVRDMMLLQNELLTKAEAFAKAKQNYSSEIDRLKRVHQTEESLQREKARKDLLEVTQQQIQLQAKMLDVQEDSEDQLKALEETKALHSAEIERLKLESFIELERLSQDCASREVEWRAQDLALQTKLKEAVAERIEITLSSKTKSEELTSLLEASQQALAKETEMTGMLQRALNQAAEESRSLKENLVTALSKGNDLSIAVETLKQEAFDSSIAYSSAISDLESKAECLRADLTNMTNVCATNENDIEKYRIKVDELAVQLVKSHKEVNLMSMEIDQLRKELHISNLQTAAKEEERRRAEVEAETKARDLTAEISRLQLESIAKSEESGRKIKEILDTRLEQQIQAHDRNVQSLHQSFLSQLEEHTKGNELKLESMEENLRRQREEKTRAKDVCAEYAKALRVVEHILKDQEPKIVSQLLTYEKKIVELEEKLSTLESKGPALEDDFNLLLKQVLKYKQQSKQVGAIREKDLQKIHAACAILESRLTNLSQEYGSSTTRYCEEIELLKESIADQDRAHKLAIAAVSRNHSSEIQQYVDDIQRLKEAHSRELAELVREHKMEIDQLSIGIQAHKDADMAEQRAKLDSCLRRKDGECNEKMELMSLEYEKVLRELRNALDAAEKKEGRLLRAHLNSLKDQQEESGEKIERYKQSNKEALLAAKAVSQKLAHELYELKEDHMMEVQETTENFEIQLSSVEKQWRQRLETVDEEWLNRLTNQESTSRKQLESDVEELRNSLLTSYVDEKLKLKAEQKKQLSDLRNQNSELERHVTQKDRRIGELLQVIKKIEESSRVALLAMKANHKQHVCDMLEKEKTELSELQRQGTAVIEELQTKHRLESLASQKLQMQEVHHELEGKLEKLQKRFENRESKAEDVARIVRLQQTCLQKDSAIKQLNDKACQLKLELVNREETYNRLFGNAPTIQQGISDWLRPRVKTEVVKVDGSKGKMSVDTTKVDIVKLQKRAASATRRNQSKGPELNVRSASTQP